MRNCSTTGEPRLASLRVIERKRELFNSDLIEQCQKIERRVFPKHESMTDTFALELRKESTRIAIASVSKEHSDEDSASVRRRFEESQNGDEIVGYVIFVKNAGGGEISKLCISTSFRRQGIGAALLDMAIEFILHGPKQPAKGKNKTKPSDKQGSRAHNSASRCVPAPTTPNPEHASRETHASPGPNTTARDSEALADKQIMLQVDPSREEAARLYRSRGFRTVRVLADYYCPGRDAVQMVLRGGGSEPAT